MTPRRVAIHASDPILLAGATSLLRTSPDLRVVAEGDGIDAAGTDVLLVIEERITEDLLAGLRARATEGAAGHVVLVVAEFRDSDLLPAVQAGVVAILPRGETRPADLVAAVTSAGDGSAHLPGRLQGVLIGEVRRMLREVLEPNGLTLSGLTARECDVLRLISDGFGTEEIAVKLSYSERTVKNILHVLMERHGLNNRAHAVAYALRVGAI